MSERDPRAEPEHYFLGVFYHNRDDPALLVPMRYGSGVDFNYARWPARLLGLLAVVGVVVAVVGWLA